MRVDNTDGSHYALRGGQERARFRSDERGACQLKALVLAPFAERSLQRLRGQFDVTYEPWTDQQRIHDPQMVKRLAVTCQSRLEDRA